MFETIVLATDLSPAWDEIVACGGEFKALGCSRVVLTHVITVKFFVGLEATLRAEAEPKLAEQKDRLTGQGFHVEVEMPMGLPAYSLNDVARRHAPTSSWWVLMANRSGGRGFWAAYPVPSCITPNTLCCCSM